MKKTTTMLTRAAGLEARRWHVIDAKDQPGATARPDELPSPDYLFHSMAEMAAAVAANEGSPPARL